MNLTGYGLCGMVVAAQRWHTRECGFAHIGRTGADSPGAADGMALSEIH